MYYRQIKTLGKIGGYDDFFKFFCGRREIFEIDEDEQLIGCKLDQADENNIDEEIPTAQAPKRGRGRPPGSLNKVKKKK